MFVTFSSCSNRFRLSSAVVVPMDVAAIRRWQAVQTMENHPVQSIDSGSALNTTCAVLLAAGGGSRFTGSSHKLVALLRGRPVYQWSLDAVASADLAHVIVVTGSVDLELPTWVIRAQNTDWASGQASSLQRGVAIAKGLGAEAVVVGLADQPFVMASAWRAVAHAPQPIAVATYRGERGHPVRLHRSVWADLASEGDQGARSLMALRPELVGEVACEGSAADVDTMEDLQQWNSSTNLL